MFPFPPPSQPHRPKLAVLIDAENISHRFADKLFEEISSLGDAPVRRIYGDFSSPPLGPWKAAIFRHAIAPQHHVPPTAGKNGADIALTIDAMDLMHRGGLDGFCLVSSDGDFTRLAIRLREAGANVHGFGRQEASKSLQHACNNFIYLDTLYPDLSTDTKSIVENPAKKPPAAAIPLIRKAIAQLEGDLGSWFLLTQIGSKLKEQQPDFDSRCFGGSNLSKLVQATGFYDIELRDNKTYIRQKRF